MKSFEIFKTKVDAANLSDVFNLIEKTVKDRLKTQIVTVNNEILLEARVNSRFREVVNRANLRVVDSVGVKAALDFLFGARALRLPGADLFWQIIERAGERGWKISFLGGARGVGEQAKTSCSKRVPAARIVAVVDGVAISPDKADKEIIATLNQAKPDIVFVALGVPKQELWVSRNLSQLSPAVYIGVGGTLDYAAGRVARAPAFMRRLGLEWLFRLIRQPRRITRIAKAVAVFPILVLREKHILKKTS